jgi:hypothetical protein
MVPDNVVAKEVRSILSGYHEGCAASLRGWSGESRGLSSCLSGGAGGEPIAAVQSCERLENRRGAPPSHLVAKEEIQSAIGTAVPGLPHASAGRVFRTGKRAFERARSLSFSAPDGAKDDNLALLVPR